MEIVLLKQAREDRDYWKRTGNKRIIKRITNYITQHKFLCTFTMPDDGFLFQ